MRERLEALVGDSPAAFTDIRFERRWRTTVASRQRRMEYAAATNDLIGVVRCLNPDHGWGFATFGDLSEGPIAVRTAHEFSLAMPQGQSIELSALPPRQTDLPCPPGRDPRDVQLDTKRVFVRGAAESLFGVDRRIVDVRVKWEDRLIETWLVSSEGMSLSEARPAITVTALVVAEETGTVERSLDSYSTAGALGDVEAWLERIPAVSERAVAALHAVPVRPARYPVVLDPRFAALIVHRVIGHRCAAGGRPGGELLPIGTRIGPDSLTIGDDGKTAGLRGTGAFDCEGVQTQDTRLIRNGVVVAHLHTRASAAKVGAVSTGNARAASAGFPSARLTNTYLAKGSGAVTDLLRDVDLGVYLGNPESANDDGLVTFHAGLGRMIRRGELAEPVKGASLRGDPLSLFGLVDAVGGDFEWDSSASQCELDGQTIPVGTGAPHVRLVEAVVGERS